MATAVAASVTAVPIGAYIIAVAPAPIVDAVRLIVIGAITVTISRTDRAADRNDSE
jgi:hypothetical protein